MLTSESNELILKNIASINQKSNHIGGKTQ